MLLKRLKFGMNYADVEQLPFKFKESIIKTENSIQLSNNTIFLLFDKNRKLYLIERICKGCKKRIKVNVISKLYSRCDRCDKITYIKPKVKNEKIEKFCVMCNKKFKAKHKFNRRCTICDWKVENDYYAPIIYNTALIY